LTKTTKKATLLFYEIGSNKTLINKPLLARSISNTPYQFGYLLY